MSRVLFNPYTGEPRRALDVDADPQGRLIVAPDEPLAPTQDAFKAFGDWLKDGRRYRPTPQAAFMAGWAARGDTQNVFGGYEKWLKAQQAARASAN